MIWIALLRGVNVGGANRLPMATLRALLARLGVTDPQTYIQSGNAIFRSDLARGDLARMIGKAIAGQFGFRPDVFLMRIDELAAAIAGHPFGGADPGQVHAFVLSDPAPTIDLDAIAALAAASEKWHLAQGIFYLHAPDGIGKSRLVARLPRLVHGPMTARNLRTLNALADLAAARL